MANYTYSVNTAQARENLAKTIALHERLLGELISVRDNFKKDEVDGKVWDKRLAEKIAKMCGLVDFSIREKKTILIFNRNGMRGYVRPEFYELWVGYSEDAPLTHRAGKKDRFNAELFLDYLYRTISSVESNFIAWCKKRDNWDEIVKAVDSLNQQADKLDTEYGIYFSKTKITSTEFANKLIYNPYN